MALINPTGQPPETLNNGELGRLILGTNSADHIINLKWGDLVFGGNGPDVFDFSSNIGSLGLGRISRVYGDTNAEYDPVTNPDAHHVPGARLNGHGGDLVNGAAGVWATAVDTFIFHGRGDPSNPGIFLGMDLTEGDQIGMDFDTLTVAKIKLTSAGLYTENGMITGTLAYVELQAASGNLASPNAYLRADFQHDKRGTWHPQEFHDENGSGKISDEIFAFAAAGYDGIGQDWILQL